MKKFNREEKVVRFINPLCEAMIEVRVVVKFMEKKYVRYISIIKIGNGDQIVEYNYYDRSPIFHSFESFEDSVGHIIGLKKKNLDLLKDVKKFFNKKIA